MARSHILSRRLNLGSALRGSPRLGHYVFAFVFLVRLIALARLTSSPFLLPSSGDMHFYDDWARQILHGRFTDHFAFYGLPLYAYLLAFLYKVFGYSPFVPGFLQACLDAGTATLLYKIAVRVFRSDERTGAEITRSAIGILAALGWAFFVPAQAYSVILMPTAWFVFVFWFLVWQIVKADHAPSPLRCLAYGALIGITATGIATILFIVPLVLAALLLRPRSDPASQSPWIARGARHCAAFSWHRGGHGTLLDPQLFRRARSGFLIGAQRDQFLARKQSRSDGISTFSRIARRAGCDVKGFD